MDIVVKGILSYIQSLEGHKSSVLAGGAVRDEIFGLVPNDYDFFIPAQRPRDIEELARSISREFNVSPLCKSKDYGLFHKKAPSNGQGVLSVWGFTFEEKKIDLIGLQENDDEDFPFEVIRPFDYGVNMVYDNGSYVDTEASDFRHDRENFYMSLINLQDISGLPKAIQRFEKFNERQKTVTGTDLNFRAPCLEFKGKKEKRVDSYKESYGYRSSEDSDIFSRPSNTMRTVDVGNGLSSFRPVDHSHLNQQEALRQTFDRFQSLRTQSQLVSQFNQPGPAEVDEISENSF